MRKLFIIAALIVFTCTTTMAQISIFESSKTEESGSSSSFMNSGAETQSLADDSNLGDPSETVPIVESIIALIGLGGAYVIGLVRKNRKEK